MTDRIDVVYVENETKLLWLIGLGLIYDENHTRQWRDQSVSIKPLKAWHDVINLEFIIYIMIFQFHFYLSLLHVLYFMSIVAYIFCIERDLGALGVA